jgi:hypothetical protein
VGEGDLVGYLGGGEEGDGFDVVLLISLLGVVSDHLSREQWQ